MKPITLKLTSKLVYVGNATESHQIMALVAFDETTVPRQEIRLKGPVEDFAGLEVGKYYNIAAILHV